MKFDPDYVVAPGATLADWFAENGLPLARTAARYGINALTLDGLLNGTEPITEEVARKLHDMTQVSASFWLALEHNFRVGLAAGKTWSKA